MHLPIEIIDLIVSFIIGEETCANFLIACSSAWYNKQNIIQYIRPLHLTYAHYNLRNASKDSVYSYLRLPNVKSTICLQLYIDKGVPIETFGKIINYERFIFTNSVKALEFLLERNVLDAMLRVIDVYICGIIRREHLEMLNFILRIKPVKCKLSELMYDLSICKNVEIFKIVFKKIAIINVEIPSLVSYFINKNNLVGVKFLVNDCRYDLTDVKIFDAELPMLEFLFAKCDIDITTDMLDTYYKNGMAKEYRFLLARANCDHHYNGKLSTKFIVNCDAEFLNRVRNHRKTLSKQFHFEFSHFNNVKDFDQQIIEVMLYNCRKLFETITEEKYYTMRELGYFEGIEFIFNIVELMGKEMIETDPEWRKEYYNHYLLGMVQKPYSEELVDEIYNFLEEFMPDIMILDNALEKIYRFQSKKLDDLMSFNELGDFHSALRYGNEYAIRKYYDKSVIDAPDYIIISREAWALRHSYRSREV
jgi:hypothetical protein